MSRCKNNLSNNQNLANLMNSYEKIPMNFTCNFSMFLIEDSMIIIKNIKNLDLKVHIEQKNVKCRLIVSLNILYDYKII